MKKLISLIAFWIAMLPVIAQTSLLTETQGNSLPDVITGEATGITKTSAVLHGFVDPNGSQTYVTFEFGTTTSYGTFLSCGYFSGDSLFPVSGTLSNLTPGTLYHFRINGTNSYGTVNGADSMFTTLPADSLPTAITEGTTNITNSGGTIHGLFNANGYSATKVLEFGLTTSYGSFTSGQVSGYDDSPMEWGIYGLLPNTTYHYRAYIIYPGGTVYGNDSTFTTLDSTECNADFTYYQYAGMTFQFVDLSSGNPSSWYWTFGDGGTSTDPNPSHEYNAQGWYNVQLTISDTATGCYDFYNELVYAIDSSSSCYASFYSVPDSNALYTYSFFDQSQGDITSWTWNFGDGTSPVVIQFPNNPNVIHTYAQAGIYYVCLSVQGSDSSCFDTQCDTLFVGGGAGCQAQFTYYPDSMPSTNYAFQFIDLSLGTPVSWFWDFGDSTYSSDQNPLHVFPGPGNYYVCLTIQCQGMQSTWCQQVVVGNNPGCISYFTYQQFDLQVAFNGFMVNQQPAGFMWDFGDGQTADGQSVSHTYANQGMYYVTLTTVTSDSLNCTYSSGQIIQVGDSSQFNQIYGQVFAGNFPITAGLAMIFSIDTSNNYNPFIDISYIDSMGVYYFPMVPLGNYVVYAMSLDSNGYLPTYYGDVLYWEDATIIQLGQPNNPYEIHLISAGNMSMGSGNINGQINNGNLKSSMLDKITMQLMDSQGNMISFNRVTSQGDFVFPSLTYGTYLLHAEIAGITSDVVQVILSQESPTANVQMTFSGNGIQGIPDIQPAIEAGAIYPNPVTDQVSIAIRSDMAVELTVELFSMTGQHIIRVQRSLQAGQNTVNLKLTGIPAGIYTLMLYSDQGVNITRKLLKTQ